ncbi:MAG: ABC transporter permease [candidate division Zixibacteria bacterium]
MRILISIIGEAVSALWANRLRSGLTVLGMIMGVTSVIAVVSLVEGWQAQIEDTFESLGPRAFIVSRFGFNYNWADYVKMLKRKKITRGLITPVKEACPDCEDVGAEAFAYRSAKYGSQKMRRLEIRGETPNVLAMRSNDILMGRYINWEDEYRKKNVAVIGYKIYTKLFEESDPIEKKFKIGNVEFIVIGVMEKLDSEIVQGLDEEIVIPLSTHQKIYKQPGNPVRLMISAVTLDKRDVAMEQVRSALRAIRHVPFADTDDFEIYSPTSLLSFINDITRASRVIMISLPLLSIVIGGIVIMNIMMVSVTERTREIGIRKSLGASQNKILVQFLYEAVILSLIGGLIGVFLGIKTGQYMLVNWMDVFITPTTMAIVLGFGISTGVGLFFGIYPARKAARLDPIKALTYE